MMNKQEYISYKIKKLEKEDKGRSHSQNVAIAISLANKKYQDGGMYNYPQPYSPYQPFPGGDFQYQPQVSSVIPEGFTSRPIAPTPANTPTAEILPQQPNINYNDSYNNRLYNPYTGVNLESALFTLGQSLNYDGNNTGANTVRGIASAAKIGLGGARTLLSGAGYQNRTDNTYQDFYDKLYNPSFGYQTIYQEGGTVSNAQVLTGAYLPQTKGVPNAEIENNEFVKDGETGEIAQAVGDTHENGGIPVSLTNNTKILSDHTKIGAKKAKLFKKEFDLKGLKASDTYADVMEKYNKKLGWNELIEEEAKTIETIGDQEQSSIKTDTKDINLNYLSDKLQGIQVNKEEMKPVQNEAFEKIFNEQEKEPKKDVVENKMQEGGTFSPEILMLAERYNLTPERIVQLMQENQPQQPQTFQAGGAFYTPSQFALPEYGNQPFGSVDYLAGDVANPDIATQRLLAQANQLPFTLRQSGLLGDNNTVTLNNAEAVRNFQTNYSNYIDRVQQAIDVNPNLTDAEKEDLKNRAITENFTNDATGVKSKDAILGNYTTSRGSFNLPIFTAEDRLKYPEVKRIGDIIDEKGNIKPEYKDLSPQTAELVKKSVGDTPTSAFDIGVLDVPTQQPNIDLSQTPQDNTTTLNRDMVNYSMVQTPTDFLLPPSPAEPVYKASATLTQIDPTKISIEPNLIEASRQSQAAADSFSYLPDSQRAAAIASILSQTQTNTNQAISVAEQANAQSQNQANLYNAQVSDKQQLLDNQFNLDYERRAFGSQLNAERDLRQYLSDLNDQQRFNFNYIDRRNAINESLPNFNIGQGQLNFQDTNGRIFYVPANALGSVNYNSLSPESKRKLASLYLKSSQNRVR